ncbi:hypothetical protein V6N13_022959 [Hibiscus sabdariffa]|uniref:Uncharacterized protein n=2 Tax=Hibiscus sabdariffa TaxID=183260 RepID=A0ABR2NUP7_9ROSI
MQESESSTKRSKTQSLDYGDSPDYVLEPLVVTRSYDRGLDDNDRPVMQSRVPTCSFCPKQHVGTLNLKRWCPAQAPFMGCYCTPMWAAKGDADHAKGAAKGLLIIRQGGLKRGLPVALQRAALGLHVGCMFLDPWDTLPNVGRVLAK